MNAQGLSPVLQAIQRGCHLNDRRIPAPCCARWHVSSVA